MTVTRMVQERAEHDPSGLAFRFLPNGRKEEQTLTFRELDTEARTVAAAIQRMTGPGDRVLLLYPTGLNFVTAFFGSLYAGRIGVPTPTPRLNRSLGWLRTIFLDAQPEVVLTTANLRNLLRQRIAEIPECASVGCLATDEPFENDPAQRVEIEYSPEAIAYLQYTSGSTTTPRGVMISHRNLKHNLDLVQELSAFDEETPFVSWLPHYHDMGLCALLVSIYGSPVTFMPPTSFVQQPYRWLQAMTRWRATHTAAPNSAYDLCVRATSLEQRADLDLRFLRVVFNGAEPVRADTIDRFVAAFGPCGFRREAFVPSFGLAEARLFVSGFKKSNASARVLCFRKNALQKKRAIEAKHPEEDGITLVSCGRVAKSLRVRIVDPKSRRNCLPDRIGEIWISGESVGRGYWNRPDDTAETFQAYLSDTGEGPFLRTGDLGFLKDDELFVTGRLKDVLLIWGRNHYPHDLERTLEGCHPALRSSAAAAFGVEIGAEERPVIVAEMKRRSSPEDAPKAIDAIRRKIAEAHELDLYAVCLARWGTLPMTTSGKIQRNACRVAFLAKTLDLVGEWTHPPSPEAVARTNRVDEQRGEGTDSITTWMISKIAAETGVAPAEIDIRSSFASLGLDSLAAVRLTGELEQWLGQSISPTLIYEHVNIEALAAHLSSSAISPSRARNPRTNDRRRASTDESIAIIGVGCRFPGAEGPQAYWRMLREGIDAISETPAHRWDPNHFYDSRPMTPGKMNTRWGGFLDRIDLFDCSFFNISPREATSMDPQQRLLLEVAWEALEDAGQTRENLAGTPVGVFIGISTNEYGALQLTAPGDIDAYWCTGNAPSIAANRISYTFNFHGPSVAIDTACSSSLVAIHLACQSLRQGESTTALVGGVNLMLTPTITVNFSMGGGTSPDGRCKAFDAEANGIVRGEGVGVVLLKPLDRALADDDPIYAVIRGSAVNQDGSTNGIVAPSREAQESVLRLACQNSGVRPAQLHYIEAHGTGTFLGDPIEATALGNVFGAGRADGGTCLIGSVKSNIGHLEAAGGIASLIKVALALKHREIPPSLHFHKPNPHIPFEALHLKVQRSLSAWPERNGVATAGVSAFGFGGTNAHVVLQAAPFPASNGDGQQVEPYLLPLSARSGKALRALAQAYLEESRLSLKSISLGDLCYTASVRRTHHHHRAAFVFSSPQDLVNRLEAFVSAGNHSRIATGGCPTGQAPRVAFVFSGHGSQWWAMGRALLAHEPVFRSTVQTCDRLLKRYAKWSLLKELEAEESCSCLELGRNRPEISFEVSQVLLFAVQVALAELWKNWGVRPVAVVGHSMGEIAAASVAGALSLEDAVRVIFYRSHLMQEGLNRKTTSGAMALVRMSRAEAQEAMSGYEDRLSLAAHNAPQTTLLSGDESALREFLQSLKKRGIVSRLARVPGAGHSPQVEPLRQRLIERLDGENGSSAIQSHAEGTPIFSTVTGRKESGTVFNATYWGRNMREPVFFAEAIAEMIAENINYFLEISPDPLLVSSIQQCLRHADRQGKALPTLRRTQPDREAVLEALGVLYADGYPINWHRLYSKKARCISLPLYRWQRERFWLPHALPFALKDPASDRAEAGKTTGLDDLIYHLEWELAAVDTGGRTAQVTEPSAWLIFSDHGRAGKELRQQLIEQGKRCCTVLAGNEYRQFESLHWEIDPTQPEHFRRLLVETAAPGRLGIIHLWSLDAAPPGPNLSWLKQGQDLGCISVLHLIQALTKQTRSQPSWLWLITGGSQQVDPGKGEIAIAQAPLWALGRVIRFEHPELRCRMIDLSLTNKTAETSDLLREVQRDDGEDHIALRGGTRYRARLGRGISAHQSKISRSDAGIDFRSDATYLIAGGLGGLGLTTAAWMVEKGARHLALVARRSPSSQAAAVIADLKRKGANVMVSAADIIDPKEVDRILSAIRREAPLLRGIIHAAAHLDDGLLGQLTRERFESVTAPKISGAWNLHVQTLADELDFFVMFSSVASLLGSPGQANYAVANAFLDALAAYRVSIDLPALSVNWGPWASVGGAARDDRAGHLARLGFGSIAPEQGVETLGRLLVESAPQVAVMPVNWPQVARAYPSAIQWPLLSSQWKQNGEASRLMPDPTIVAQPDETDEIPDDYTPPRTEMEERLATIWMEVSGAKRVSVHGNLLKLGGDSLMAVQMLSKVSELTSVELSTELFLSHPTIASLATALERSPNPPVTAPPITESSAEIQIESRPLLSLFATGNIDAVDGAAICYIARSYLDRSGLTDDDVINGWCHGLPAYIARLKTSLGAIGLILLPVPESQLYRDQAALVKSVVEALQIAKHIGARSVSLMGLLPSASDYGRAIATAIAGRTEFPMITTGHATTAAAVVLNLEKILQTAVRDLSREQVAFLGLGSVGLATLRLMLRCLPPPARLVLCDVYSKRELLETVRQEIVQMLGNATAVDCVESTDFLPNELYEASLIIGATNVPAIVDIARVMPGTILIDDSAPHCFATHLAIKRFKDLKDILFTEGGMMSSPQPTQQLFHVPGHAQPALRAALLPGINSRNLPGCILSSLLSFEVPELKPTVGLVETDNSVRHYHALRSLGFAGANLHCEDYVLPTEGVNDFRRRFGNHPFPTQVNFG